MELHVLELQHAKDRHGDAARESRAHEAYARNIMRREHGRLCFVHERLKRDVELALRRQRADEANHISERSEARRAEDDSAACAREDRGRERSRKAAQERRAVDWHSIARDIILGRWKASRLLMEL